MSLTSLFAKSQNSFLLLAEQEEVSSPSVWDSIEGHWQDLLQQAGMSLLIFAGFWVVARIVQKVLTKVGTSQHIDQELASFIGRTAKISVLILGLITALSHLGIDVSAMVAGLGLTGFALGFALKDVISNVLAGVLILIYKPFQKDDCIKIKSYEGKVVSTDLRYTVLLSDGLTVYVPNSLLFTDAITVTCDAVTAEPEVESTE